MNYQFFVVLTIMAAAAVILYFVWYKPKQAKRAARIQKNCPPTHVATTAYNICLPKETADSSVANVWRPDGGNVISEKGFPDQATKDKIGEVVTRGIQRMIRAATYANPTWTKMLNSGQYNVFMIPKQATNLDGTPALLVGEQLIQAAGTVININYDLVERAPLMIVLPQPDDFNAPGYWDYLEASVYNEGEHVIEFYNDKSIFLRKNGGAGDVHPHWPEPPAQLGLIGARKPLGDLLATTCAIELGGADDPQAQRSRP